MKKLNPAVKTTTAQPAKPRLVYAPPSIIYEGQITARAGTVIGDKPDGSAVDPSDLFGGN